MALEMETEYKILNLYRTKQYDACNQLLDTMQGTDNRMLEFIRMRVLTILAKVAGDGYEEVGYGAQRDELVTTAVAKTPRPGTTFNRPQAKTAGFTATTRAMATTSARRQTGTASSRTLHTAARASRAATATAGASRANTAAAGVALGAGAVLPLTLTMLNTQDQLFHAAGKTLFEYTFYCEGDVRKALEIAIQATKIDTHPDWWWDYSKAKCYNALGMHRTAEESLRQALKKNKHIAVYLRLVAMYVELNQPLSALEVCKQGLTIFHDDTALTLEQARIHDEMDNSALAVQDYRRVALEDPTNMEATAYIALFNFYNDQPEIALRYYRRLLATCSPGAEIYNNLGLCCLHCNQWDLTLPCFRQALYFSTNPTIRADVWFNISHVALSTGDLQLARRCLQLSLVMSSEHESARKALRAIDAHLRNIK
ncbi:unnamed protein product [Plutella xylostella]|uniref:(diamondback moth) hypothetical protein n=1 Tax=Plutella xylostella TaxID=51655 RepID=A0A8S4G6J9_PLUXY|nr:unnamed protein product [Plutella xylostella]